MCYRHDRGKRGGGGYAPESSVQKLYTPTVLYNWLTKLYQVVGRTPCYIYRNLMKNPEENDELIARCNPLTDQMLQTFQQRLTHNPDDWYSLRGIGEMD